MFTNQSAPIILDGGLATHLETLGCNLDDPLWSARLLLDNPQIIKQAHLDYFEAGADCAIAASYQATIPGFMARGLSKEDAIALLQLSVTLAIEARDEFMVANPQRPFSPFVAASIGPYGAALADGSEYSGAYDLNEEALTDWHRQRWRLLANGPADMLACETIPSFAEARALGRLLQETPRACAWFSFSCRDGVHISDGTPIAQCAAFLDKSEQTAAIGVNCTPPRFISNLIQEIRTHSNKPIIVYPNSGEQYNAANGRWEGLSNAAQFSALADQWHKAGATLIGGCCRTTPFHIQQLRRQWA